MSSTDSSFLDTRLSINRKLGTNNFDEWSESLLKSLNMVGCSNILDVCCGTGNQIKKFQAILSPKLIVGVDISQESLEKIKENNRTNNLLLVNTDIDLINVNRQINDFKYSIISCFYGLYYSQNTSKLLDTLTSLLELNGRIVIVGPYGDNNKSVFDLLGKIYTIDKNIIDSCTSFMEKEVLGYFQEKKDMFTVEIKTFVNTVKFTNTQDLYSYIKNTTFYKEQYDSKIVKDIQDTFSTQNNFDICKHIMAIIITKIK